MQKHHVSTVFTLILIAAVAIGTFWYLSTNHPYEPPKVTGNWEGIADVEDVFGSSAAGPSAAGTSSDTSYDYEGELYGDEVALDDTTDDGSSDASGEDDAGAARTPDDTEESFNYDDFDDESAYDTAYDNTDYDDALAEDDSEAAADDTAAQPKDESDGTDVATTYPEETTSTYDVEPDEAPASDSAQSSGSGSASQQNRTQPVETARAPKPPSHVEPVPKPSGDKPVQFDAVQRWWPAKWRKGQYTLTYAGQTQGDNAIALLFTVPTDPSTLDSHVAVYNENGHPIGGTWRAGGTERLMRLDDVAPGRYTVVVGKGVATKRGRELGYKLSGPVYIR